MHFPSFDSLHRLALKRRSPEELEERLPIPRTATELEAEPDAHYLAEMTRRVFHAGSAARVIDARWRELEEAFHGFDPVRLAAQTEDEVEALMAGEAVVRHRQKLQSVRENAAFVLEIAAEHGSFGRFLAAWPLEDTVGLWEVLRKRGSRLGGLTGQIFLRSVGRDTFLLTDDVVASLIRDGVIERPPTGKADLAAVERAFHRWREESGLPLCQISTVIACGYEA
jgi:3-methyladenine DNA glycosylase Tag